MRSAQVHDQFVRARRAVLADVAAEHLYGRLVTFDELRCHRRYGPGWPVFAGTLGPSRSTMRSGVQCRGARRRRNLPGTVHVSDSYEELVIGQAQLSTGHIPERPFLLVG